MKFVLVCVLASLGLAVGQYDYAGALSKSILFYEAQRTGALVNNRIPFRGDSFLNDADGGIDLTGGFFDAGDHVKFGLPFGHTMIFLAWSALDYKAAYVASGEYDNILSSLRWGADFIFKSNQLPNALYGQVGDGNADHAYWGRPEDWPNGPRPVYKLTPQAPGSDIAGNYAAAMAIISAVFADSDAAYSARCLAAARQLYDFANNYRGLSSQSMPAAAAFYSAYAYEDELAFAAAAMALVTGEQNYKNDALTMWNANAFDSYVQNFFDWDNKHQGIKILMARVFGDAQYKTAAQAGCDYWINQNPRTPQGLVFINAWGSLRHAANAAFGCLLTADSGIGNAANYRAFAKQQIDYALGSTGRSFLVGFGNNPPQKVHHRAASCPNRPAVCDYNNYNSPNPNPQVLNGALAGGPDANDQYQDDRTNFQCNEVAIDYNAGFQAALAGILNAQLKGQL